MGSNLREDLFRLHSCLGGDLTVAAEEAKRVCVEHQLMDVSTHIEWFKFKALDDFELFGYEVAYRNSFVEKKSKAEGYKKCIKVLEVLEPVENRRTRIKCHLLRANCESETAIKIVWYQSALKDMLAAKADGEKHLYFEHPDDLDMNIGVAETLIYRLQDGPPRNQREAVDIYLRKHYADNQDPDVEMITYNDDCVTFHLKNEKEIPPSLVIPFQGYEIKVVYKHIGVRGMFNVLF